MPSIPAIDTRPSRRCRRPRALVVIVAASLNIALLSLGPAGSQAAKLPNPTANLRTGPMPIAAPGMPKCPPAPTDTSNYLDQARATMGLGPYALPANFLAKSRDLNLVLPQVT